MSEPILENIIAVRFPEPLVNSISLFPKASLENVRRYVAFSNAYVQFYSLTQGVRVQKPTGNPDYPDEFALRFLDRRSPLDTFSYIRERLSTRWLGRSPSSIEEDITEIEKLLAQLKEERSRQTF